MQQNHSGQGATGHEAVGVMAIQLCTAKTKTGPRGNESISLYPVGKSARLSHYITDTCISNFKAE